ncbi:MAG: hypothetical protein IJM30_12635 [Thermoguttaceae bacterium]|nr:hypothetical protein [Thermoguttaceae bacterium]
MKMALVALLGTILGLYLLGWLIPQIQEKREAERVARVASERSAQLASKRGFRGDAPNGRPPRAPAESRREDPTNRLFSELADGTGRLDLSKIDAITAPSFEREEIARALTEADSDGDGFLGEEEAEVARASLDASNIWRRRPPRGARRPERAEGEPPKSPSAGPSDEGEREAETPFVRGFVPSYVF